MVMLFNPFESRRRMRRLGETSLVLLLISASLLGPFSRANASTSDSPVSELADGYVAMDGIESPCALLPAVSGSQEGVPLPNTQEQAVEVDARRLDVREAGKQVSQRVGASSAMALQVVPVEGATASFLTSGSDLQIFGKVGPGLDGVALTVLVTTACAEARDLQLVLQDDGSAALTVTLGDLGSTVYSIPEPWAFDEAGVSVPVQYRVDGFRLQVAIDTREASGSTIFDPTFMPLTCMGHFSALGVVGYLDIAGTTDVGRCPVNGMMSAAGKGMPIWGHEGMLASTVGKVAVQNGGDSCSNAPDSGPHFDFKVPCKAHDYCYDLIRAGFGGTLTKADCDTAFRNLMDAHCDAQYLWLRISCAATAGIYYAFVIALGTVSLQVGTVSIASGLSGQCATVDAGGTADFTNIHQWTYVGVNHQKFRIYPAGGGWFRLLSEHASKCSMAVYSNVYQSTCGGYSAELYRIQGALGLNAYSLRSQADTNKCWHATSPVVGSNIDNTGCDDYHSPWIWSING